MSNTVYITRRGGSGSVTPPTPPTPAEKVRVTYDNYCAFGRIPIPNPPELLRGVRGLRRINTDDTFNSETTFCCDLSIIRFDPRWGDVDYYCSLPRTYGSYNWLFCSFTNNLADPSVFGGYIEETNTVHYDYFYFWFGTISSHVEIKPASAPPSAFIRPLPLETAWEGQTYIIVGINRYLEGDKKLLILTRNGVVVTDLSHMIGQEEETDIATTRFDGVARFFVGAGSRVGGFFADEKIDTYNIGGVLTGSVEIGYNGLMAHPNYRGRMKCYYRTLVRSYGNDLLIYDVSDGNSFSVTLPGMIIEETFNYGLSIMAVDGVYAKRIIMIDIDSGIITESYPIAVRPWLPTEWKDIGPLHGDHVGLYVYNRSGDVAVDHYTKPWAAEIFVESGDVYNLTGAERGPYDYNLQLTVNPPVNGYVDKYPKTVTGFPKDTFFRYIRWDWDDDFDPDDGGGTVYLPKTEGE